MSAAEAHAGTKRGYLVLILGPLELTHLAHFGEVNERVALNILQVRILVALLRRERESRLSQGVRSVGA